MAASKDKRKKRRRKWRAAKFWMLRHLLLPCLKPIVLLWFATMRLDQKGPVRMSDFDIGPQQKPRTVACLHENVICCLAGFTRIPKREKPDFTVLASPSRDGQLVGDVVRWVGANTATGSSSSSGAGGLLSLVRLIRREGRCPFITVDGPRGPRGVPKGGILLLSKAARSELYTMAVLPTRYKRVGSWDRLIIPYPFSTLKVVIAKFHDYAEGDWPGTEDEARAALQAQLMESFEEIGADMSSIERIESGED